MSSRQLAVLLYGQHVADLEQTQGGQHRLTYHDDPGTTPISLTMPLGGGPFRQRVVGPFLEGLLPERESAREAMSREFDVSARNPFALLANMGLDCAGAVQFCAEDEVADVLARSGTLEPLTDRDIERRLAELRTNPAASWLAPRERWSLAGAQAKFALRREGEAWCEATGAEPTTHIIKPGVDGFRSQALNEHISLQTARRTGLSAAKSSFERFGSESALIVERYDRRRDRDGHLVRLHQEDMCQATGTYPGDKYESGGGPRAVRIVDLLRASSTRSDRQHNLDAFVDALAFNVLIRPPTPTRRTTRSCCSRPSCGSLRSMTSRPACRTTPRTRPACARRPWRSAAGAASTRSTSTGGVGSHARPTSSRTPSPPGWSASPSASRTP